MTGTAPFSLWLAVFFCVACEPSVTQSSATVPISTSTAHATPDTASVKPKQRGESPANTGDKTIFVREERVDCEGEGPMLCMQVRDAGSEEWTLFYGKIEGFSYEEGHAYELRVRVADVKTPPADRSSQRVRLVEIVSKEKTSKQ